MFLGKLKIPYCEFYITNVCNLACAGCNRFNNYDFKGFQRWLDYADTYTQWSKEVDIDSIAILGGEPMLNPDFMLWVKGISELWPRTTIRIISNGYQLEKVRGLYELLKSNPKIKLWIGIHNKLHKKPIVQRVKSFLKTPCTVVHNNSDPFNEYQTLTNSEGVTVKIEYNWWFHQGAIVNGGLHNSDVKKAHDICHMKTCHHFVRGQLYKCGVVAVLPEFDQQHPLTLSKEDRELIHSYRALNVTDSIEFKQQFIANLDQPIDQCKFCPEKYHGDQIFALEKKQLK